MPEHPRNPRAAAKTAKASKSFNNPNPAKPSKSKPARHTRSAPKKLSDSGVARATAKQWADQARSGTARTAALNASRLAEAMDGGDRRLAEFCMELLAELPVPVLFAIGADHLSHGSQGQRWALAQTLAQAFQKKPLVETLELAERCLQKTLDLLKPWRLDRQATGAAARNAQTYPAAQAILWLEAMNGSAVWLQPSEKMKVLIQKVSTAAAVLPAEDQDNLRSALLRLIAQLPEIWAQELMIDALAQSPWVAFAGIDALRPHPGERIDQALWSTLIRLRNQQTPIVLKALYAALTERAPVDLLPPIWTRLADCPTAWLPQHIGLLAACSQQQPAAAAQVARASPPGSLERLLAISTVEGAYTAYQACEIIARVGDAANAAAMADLANRFAGQDGFDMIAFACSRTLRQWVGTTKARALLSDKAASGLRRALPPT